MCPRPRSKICGGVLFRRLATADLPAGNWQTPGPWCQWHMKNWGPQLAYQGLRPDQVSAQAVNKVIFIRSIDDFAVLYSRSNQMPYQVDDLKRITIHNIADLEPAKS